MSSSNRGLLFCTLLASFALASPLLANIQIDFPNGGESFSVDDDVTIQWTVIAPFPTQDWDIYYSTSGASGPWTTIALNVPVSGSVWAGTVHTYDWTVPSAAASPTVWVRVVQDNSGLDFEDVSNAPFEVQGADVQFCRGDANADGGFDIADAIYTLAALFVPGSPVLTCVDAADSNDDGSFDISDAIYSLSAQFVSGAPVLSAPFGACGIDPTTDTLDCAAFAPCP